jgi:putative transposase
MSDSYCHLASHIIFSTKDRHLFLFGDNQTEMHNYIAGIIKNIKGIPIIVNGYKDHVHILCLLPKDMSIAQFVQTIKSNSSKWFRVKHQAKFAWQVGYAAFSVSKSNLQQVEQYIAEQEEHHGKLSFEDELKTFLLKHGFELKPDSKPQN